MACTNWQYIIGFGSLLCEKSAKITMPSLRNFQFARLTGYRRVFGHPANVFVKWGIAKMDTKELSSLSVEPDPNANSFIVSVFEIPKSELNAFYAREDEFAFKEETVKLLSKPTNNSNNNQSLRLVNELLNIFVANNGDEYIRGLLCVRSTDDDYIKTHGQSKFDKEWKSVGLNTIWHWDGAIYPCRVYLRHCLLSIKKQGQFALDDFMNNTFLYDRQTTIKQYMDANPEIYNETVPSS
eukprot:288083_1